MMFFVKQLYAEWVGVMNPSKDECTSGTCVFLVIDKDRRDQLIKYDPSLAEMISLERCLIRSLPNRTDYIDFVRGKINEKRQTIG